MNIVELSFSAKTENVVLARSLATVYLLNLNPKNGIINEVKTIISEAVTNAIIHGYEEDEKEMVYLKISLYDNLLVMEIKDTGCGIANIEEAKRPMFSSKKTDERSGLGFTIIEVFSDTLEIISEINNGTTLKITKKIYGNHENNPNA